MFCIKGYFRQSMELSLLTSRLSGNPIIQDGKRIGAVTHVLVDDPTMGYGIFIENMLDAAG